MDWLMKYSECKDTGLRVCEVYEHLLVREDGMVRNISGNRNTKKEWHSGNKLNTIGYRQIRIPGKRSLVMVHRAVALAFIDNPLSYEQCNHINHDTSYNDISNLEWCNNRQNCSMQKQHNSKLVGASYKKARSHLADPWSSQILINGRYNHIGYYDTEQCAHDAYIAYKALHNII